MNSFVVMIFVVVYRFYSWIGLLLAFLHWGTAWFLHLYEWGPEKGGSAVRSKLNLLSSVSKACGVFISRVLPSLSERQPREGATNHIIVCIAWYSKSNSSKGFQIMPYLRVYVR